MKFKAIRTLLWCGLSILIGNRVQAQPRSANIAPLKALETGFASVPDSIQTTVYWYWLSDNISSQGVIKDLEAMKKVGINRAFIGNIGLDDVPFGKVKLFTPEWWEVMHTALKTATKLNIEIGIFNSPGWSQSGGPWVKPEQSMRYLASTQMMVKGPMAFNGKLKKPVGYFEDVKVIAYPVPDDFAADISLLKPVLTSIPANKDLSLLMDENETTGIKLKNDEKFQLDISCVSSYTARSVIIYPAPAEMILEGDIQVKQGDQFVTLKHFKIDRSKSRLIVGFKPFGQANISIPATRARNFRIILTRLSGNPGINGIKVSSTPVVEDYIEKTLAKMWQTPLPYWDAYQWNPQPVVDDNKYVIDPKRVVSISDHMAPDGTLTWTVPAGNWIIERCGMAPTNVTNAPATKEGTGLETDKMSKKHIASHFNAFLGEIIKRVPAEDRKTWRVTVEDSYETGGQNWTDGFIEKFKVNYGYDPTPFLPVLRGEVVASEDQSDRFLWDLRRFVADNVAYEYVGGLRDISHRNGLKTWLECYGHWGFPGEFLQYGGQSDEVAGEFWSTGSLGNIENRSASSAAHIYGKTKVSAESFTGGGSAFSQYPALMKQRADRFFTEGINSSLLHVFVHQAYDKPPGINASFGSEFNRLNTWFYDMDIFLQYLKRCNLMLQQGRYVADVAYFIGEDAPKMTGVQNPALPKGYSFDYINGEVIKTRVSIKNGRLALPDGMQYSILVLPKLETMRPELLLKIKELVKLGMVVLGPKPSRSPSLQNFGKADEEVKTLAGELWGDADSANVSINHVGKGMVMSGMSLQKALDLLRVVPDFKTAENDSVLFIHRALDDGSVYFVSNQSKSTIRIKASFRITGKVPELWDAITGSTRLLPSYKQTAVATEVPIELAPLQSAFIVFRNNGNRLAGDLTKSNYPLTSRSDIIKGQWIVNFNPKTRGPVMPVVFDTLGDWSQSKNDSIKYYSGTATYHKTIMMNAVNPGEHVLLDLGSVTAIAKVNVNGIALGGAWIAPYKVDITRALKSGQNTLEISVVNTWVNRMIGDARLQPDERQVWTYLNPYEIRSRLQPAGLIGPVKLETIKYE